MMPHLRFAARGQRGKQAAVYQKVATLYKLAPVLLQTNAGDKITSATSSRPEKPWQAVLAKAAR
jgi:hypothetical protein